MKTISLVLVGLYAALNLFLAVAGLIIFRESALWARLVPGGIFLLAAGVLTAGALRGQSWLVLVGLLVASIAPITYGALVEGHNVWLHHAVRAALALGIAAVWVQSHPASL